MPPPPSNQIIHVFLSVPMKNVQAMQAVWISGVIEVERKETDMGVAGYKMKAENVTPYKDRQSAIELARCRESGK